MAEITHKHSKSNTKGQRKKILPTDKASPARQEKKSSTSPAKTPPSDGSISRRFVRCGRANCRCKKGELHGPYLYVRLYRSGARRWQYVRNRDVSEFHEGRERRQARQAEAKKEQEEFRQMWREMKSLMRSLGL